MQAARRMISVCWCMLSVPIIDFHCAWHSLSKTPYSSTNHTCHSGSMVDADLTELQHDYETVQRSFRFALLAALVLLGGGAWAYHHMLHLDWVDAFYFCTVTLATVGYGDIVPTTDTAKIFTIFYILAGVGVIATFASLLVRNATLRRDLRRAKKSLPHDPTRV